MRSLPFCLVAIVLTAFTAAAHAQPAADYQPDPASVQRHGPAYRFPQAGWIVLHIEGEPYERGYQHGRLLAPEIAGYVRAFAAILAPKAPAEGWQNTRRLVNALFLRKFDKEFLEEMKGIADGATEAGARFDNRPIDLVDIVAINVWPEIETLDSALEASPTGLEGIRFPHQQPRAKPAPRPEHCSAFAATGPATADGKIVFGHITMFSLYASYYYNVWIDVKPAKGHRFVMCGYPGAMQSGMDYYINDAGLLIAETTIDQTRFDIKGMSEASRIRQAIQYAGTIDQAVDILKKDNNGLYTNEWLLGDINTNEIALFELGTHKSKLHRSSKKEWIGGTAGFYWGCNNTKDLELRLETVASVEGRPANVIFRPSERDIAWQKLYQQNKGKIDVGFGKLAFTTPPLAAYPSLDAKFTTTDLARQLKSYALFGPPLGRTWEPTLEERQRYPDIKSLVSNPWTILHVNPPAKPQADVARIAEAVDLPQIGSHKDANDHAEPLLNVPAWHGTLLPATDGDIWLAAAFAEYERYVAKEKAMRQRNHGELTQADRDDLAVDLFRFSSAYQSGVRKGCKDKLTEIRTSLTSSEWYDVACGKGVMLLHHLRRLYGDPLFEDTMDVFGRRHAGKKVTTEQFRQFVKKDNIGSFYRLLDENNPNFANWLPHGLSIQSAPADGRDKMQLFCIDYGDRFLMCSIDVTIETEHGEVTKALFPRDHRLFFTVNYTGEVKPGQVPDITTGKGTPRRVIVDKYGSILRFGGKAFSIMSFHAEQEQSLIVYGTVDEAPTNREAAEKLQQAIRERYNHTVPIKSDKEVDDADLKSRHLLLIGRPDSNMLIERYRTHLPISFGPRSFVVRGKTYANPGSAVIVAADNPLNPRYSMVVLAGLSAEATVHAPRKFMRRGQRAAEVLILPSGSAARALVLAGPSQTWQKSDEK